jgi:hypothetical protein
VTFVDDPARADVQILDVIGIGSLEYLYRPDSYALIQYCFLTTEEPAVNEWLLDRTTPPSPSGNRGVFWRDRFERARLVMSYYDLPSLVGSSDFPFYRAPLGVDGSVFYDRTRRPRPACVLSSGHDAYGEAIRECREAARRVGQPLIHIGSNFDWMGDGCLVACGISDAQLAEYYSQARYVSGLRRGEGFELPVVEGLACGARPICFDLPCYRFWFGEHAVFVPELLSDGLVGAITEILRTEPRAVSPAERACVLEKFSWPSICRDFWTRLCG